MIAVIDYKLPVARMLLLCWLCLASAAPAWAAPDDHEPPAEPQVNGQFEVAEVNFDQWVFQGAGNADAGRKRISSWLTLKLNEVDRACGLSDEQKQKLTLAAGGDVKRFFDEVEVVRKKFMAVRKDQNAFGQIWQDIQPLQAKLATGLFGDRSLFAKTLHKTLAPEQVAKYDAIQEERRGFRYRAAIEVSLVTLENTVPLSSDQRERLIKIMIDETQPPDAFGQQDQQYVMYALANVPKEHVKSLLDERQWKLLEPQLNGHRNMKQFLVQNGVIAIDGGKKGM
jgi:hypothetical protein